MIDIPALYRRAIEDVCRSEGAIRFLLGASPDSPGGRIDVDHVVLFDLRPAGSAKVTLRLADGNLFRFVVLPNADGTIVDGMELAHPDPEPPPEPDWVRTMFESMGIRKAGDPPRWPMTEDVRTGFGETVARIEAAREILRTGPGPASVPYLKIKVTVDLRKGLIRGVSYHLPPNPDAVDIGPVIDAYGLAGKRPADPVVYPWQGSGSAIYISRPTVLLGEEWTVGPPEGSRTVYKIDLAAGRLAPFYSELPADRFRLEAPETGYPDPDLPPGPHPRPESWRDRPPLL